MENRDSEENKIKSDQIVKKMEIGAHAYMTELQVLNDVLFVIAFMLAFFITMSSDWLILFLFGDEYVEAVPVLMIHVWSAILVFMRTLLSKWLIIEGLLKMSLISQLSGAVVNILLNALLIPNYGAIGAACATVLSYASAGYFILFFNRDLKDMRLITTRSLLLPLRLIHSRGDLYKKL